MPRTRVAVAVAVFGYVLLIRTYDIANTFLMLGEQTRDWTIALGGWNELPLTGAPSTAGGRGFGPVYYWLLWIGRHLVGPFTDNLPHAGGIVVALLQSAADTFLLIALWRRVHITLAITMVMFLASAPFDISISGVIWNPPVSAALVKMATALALCLGATPSTWKVAATAAAAWLAVQAHLSAIFVAAPLLAVLVAQPMISRQWQRAAGRAALVIAVLAVLQIPYAIAYLRQPDAAIGPSGALSSMAQAPSIRIARSYAAVVNTTGELLVRRRETWTFQLPVLIAALIVSVRWRKDLPAMAVSVGPILAATALFATWTRPYDSYWFLTATTAMVLTFGLAVAALPSPAAIQWTGTGLLVVVLLLQPLRIDQAKAFFSYPQYRAMRIGSIELARRAPVLRDIRVTFAGAHPTMDKYFMYTILGGRIDPASPQTAFVETDGRVRIE